MSRIRLGCVRSCEKACSGRPMSCGMTLKISAMRGVNLRMQRSAIQEQRADVGAVEQVLDVVVQGRQLGVLLLILRVDGVELLVDGMELLVRALQLLVRGDELLVGRLQLFVGALELLDRGLEVFLGVGQLVLQHLHAVLRHPRQIEPLALRHDLAVQRRPRRDRGRP